MRKSALTLIPILTLLIITISAMQPSYNAMANPHPFMIFYEGDIEPPNYVKPPEILVMYPENNSLHDLDTVNFTLNISQSTKIVKYQGFTIDYPYLHEVYYKADWIANTTFLEPTINVNLNLTKIPNGNHSVIVYATEWRPAIYGYDYENKVFRYNGYYITGSSTVFFTVDTISPDIKINSLENKTYSQSDIPLNFTVNEPVSEIYYVLDGEKKVIINENTTLPELHIGAHNITVFARDTVGNFGASETVSFIIVEPERFPDVTIAAVFTTLIVAVIIGLLIHFKKK